jgi:hypothetical protein
MATAVGPNVSTSGCGSRGFRLGLYVGNGEPRTEQAQRGRGNPSNCWTRSDTVIVLTLAVLAILLTLSATFGRTSPSQHTGAACFAALYFC